MHISSFEAAALYDYSVVKEDGGADFPINSLVFDLDHYSVGLCSCSAAGKTELIASYVFPEGNGMAEDVIKGISQKDVHCTQQEIRQYYEEHLESINRKMKNYFHSERQMDNVALNIGGSDISCSKLEKIFEKIKDKIRQILLKADEFISNVKCEENSLRIILAGDYAGCYIIEYYIRSNLSFDPFLPDERFVNSLYKDSPERIIDIGREVFNQMNTIDHDISLFLVGCEGVSAEIRLAEKNKAKSEYEAPNYFGPILLESTEQLEVSIDGKRKKIPVPYPVEPEEDEVIDVAVCIKTDKPVFCIRRYRFPNCIYDIPFF